MCKIYTGGLHPVKGNLHSSINIEKLHVNYTLSIIEKLHFSQPFSKYSKNYTCQLDFVIMLINYTCHNLSIDVDKLHLSITHSQYILRIDVTNIWSMR